MTKVELLEYAKAFNFELDKEVKDLSGNSFLSLRNETIDTRVIYRDQKDDDFFIVGLYSSEKADKLLKKFKYSR